MQKSRFSDLLGLKYRSTGLGFVTKVSDYIKDKEKTISHRQVSDNIEELSEIEKPESIVTTKSKKKVAKSVKVGAGRRRRRRSVKKGRRKVKGTRRRRIVRRKGVRGK